MARRKKTIGWIALSGSGEITPTTIEYRPIKIEEGPSAGQIQILVLRADKYFQSGDICFEVNLGSAESACQVILNHGLERELWVGFSGSANLYVIGAYQGGKYETISTSGWGSPAKVGQWQSVRISVVGSLVDLYVDGVKTTAAWSILQKAQIGLFFSGPAEIRVRNFQVAEKMPEAFVVMQFTAEFDALYQEVIKPTCEAFGYKCVRADDIFTSGLIIEDITSSIRDASVIVADITPNNPNVFYEVGYSHGLGKPTILLADKTRENLPFDISGFRTVFYDNTIGGKSQIEERLRKHLENLRR